MLFFPEEMGRGIKYLLQQNSYEEKWEREGFICLIILAIVMLMPSLLCMLQSKYT